MLRRLSILSLFFLLFLPIRLHADVELEPSRIDFGAVPVEQVAQAHVLVVNDDDDPITITEVGPRNAQDGTIYIVHDECSGERLREKESCRFTIGFYPTEERSYSGRIDVTYTEGRNRTSRETVRVFGEGIRLPNPPDSPPPGNDPPSSPPAQPPPTEAPGDDPEEPPAGLSLSVDAEEVTFGAVYLGTRISGTLFLINTGGVPVALGEIVSSEPFAPFALRSDGCSERTLAPGGRCGLRIEYLPWSVGDHGAALDIPYGEAGSAQTTLRAFATGTGRIAPGNTPPDVPVLIHPLPDQDNLRRSVTFRWERCVDPHCDPVGYWVFYSEDPGFAEVLPARLEPGRTRLAAFGIGTLVVAAAAGLPMRRRVRIILCVAALVSLFAACSDDIEDNATMPAFHLEAGTTYYWKVIAEDGRGGIAESEVRSFTTR